MYTRAMEDTLDTRRIVSSWRERINEVLQELAQALIGRTNWPNPPLEHITSDRLHA